MRNKPAAILGITAFFFWFGQYTYVPFVAPYLTALGATAAMIGFITGSYGLTQTILRIPIGFFADKLGRQRIFILLGSLISVVSAAGMYFFEGVYPFLFFRALSGVAAATWVSFVVLNSCYYKPEESPKATGYFNTYTYAGRLGAYLLTGAVVDVLGVKALFLLGAVTGVIAVGLCFFVKDVSVCKEPMQARDFLFVLRNRTLLIYSGLALLCQIVAFSTAYSFSSNMGKLAGGTDFEIGVMSVLFMAGTVISSILFGSILIPRLGPKFSFFAGFLVMGVYAAALPFLPSMMYFYIAQFLMGLADGGVISSLMGLSNMDVAADKKTTAMGVFQAVYGIGMTLGPIMIGAVIDQAGYAAGFVTSGSVGIAAAVLCLFLLKNQWTAPAKGEVSPPELP